MKFFSKKLNRLRKNIPHVNFKKMPKWKIALFYLLYASVAFLFVLCLAFAWFAKDLPTPSKIANRKAVESTKLYDRTGQTLLYETGDQKRTIIKFEDMPQNIKDATVSVEDANFYKHHGFDTKAILSAVYSKITKKTARTRGASTITQQYVKLALLTSDRSVIRKFKELILAIELEFMYSKDEILAMYLNEIPYGNNTAGIEAAAKMYYGKTAKDLTLSEAATLAGIPQSPTYYSPYGTHTKELINRKNYVLDRMLDTNKITKDDADKAKLEDTTTLNVALKPRRDSMLAPHFAMYVLENIADQYGEEKIQKEGLKVITTLDFEKQKIAEKSVQDGMVRITKAGGSNAALVAVDPKTGQILAMVGSKDYFDTKIDGNVNVADSLRQPGSSFKPFEYSTLFKKKEYSPSKILYDFQTDFGGGYVPKNYNGRFNGPVTIRYALANSFNIPAIKALSLAGMDNTIRTAEDLGITTLTDKDRYGLSLAIGVAEVKPVEMAGAFGVFGNGGIKNDLTPILKITDPKGKTIYDYDKDQPTGKQVLDPQIAYEISSILKDNTARSNTFGSRSALYFPDREVAVKTGTTQDDRDAWTVGYTPSISVAIWSGNNMPSPMKSGGEALSGPIFNSFIKNALAGIAKEEFQKPAGIQELTVEKYSNKLPGELSTEKNTDIFASWQVPTEKDDVHIKVRVCKDNGKLAPDGLPESLTEEKIFTNIHSERPDVPAWENPVRAWAEANGFSNSPPTEYCKAEELTPKISIISPTNNANVSGTANITVETSQSPVAISSVEYFIDNISIGTSDTSGPTFLKSYNFDSLSPGIHTILVVGTDINGTTSRISIDVTAVKSSNSISILNITKTPGTDTVTITWDTNVSTVGKVIYGENHSLNQESEITSQSTTHTVVISKLKVKTTYYFEIVASNGDSSFTSAEDHFITL